MANTTNFGWETPDDTDLVKDGASAIRTLGSAIDTSLVDLKGGTTGQVLSKASNTDMDFTWVAQDDSNAIQNALLTTTGDTIYASGASTPARLGIGTTGQVLTVSAGGIPSWATSSSGGMTLISTTSLSGASVVLSSIPATYNDLFLVIRNGLQATDSESWRCRINGDTNSRYALYSGSNFMDVSNQGFSTAHFNIIDGPDNGTSQSLVTMEFPDYANTTSWKWCFIRGITNNTTTNTNANYTVRVGAYNQTGAISSLTLYPANGNWTSGSVLLYGVK